MGPIAKGSDPCALGVGVSLGPLDADGAVDRTVVQGLKAPVKLAVELRLLRRLRRGGRGPACNCAGVGSNGERDHTLLAADRGGSGWSTAGSAGTVVVVFGYVIGGAAMGEVVPCKCTIASGGNESRLGIDGRCTFSNGMWDMDVIRDNVEGFGSNPNNELSNVFSAPSEGGSIKEWSVGVLRSVIGTDESFQLRDGVSLRPNEEWLARRSTLERAAWGRSEGIEPPEPNRGDGGHSGELRAWLPCDELARLCCGGKYILFKAGDDRCERNIAGVGGRGGRLY